MPANFNDGGLVFGSQIVAINGVNYIAEDIQISDGSRDITITDDKSLPAKQILLDLKTTGSATLQLASSNTPAPPKFKTVDLAPIGGGSPITFWITQVGTRFVASDTTKIAVQLIEKLN